ncbi:MAG: hypothetical protein C4520_16645 [Candidatus Abyssobacteria bacterium SURF_5]|uniref:Uncharacterized protein n=1 Tax=Abyssobacteria bacterium (strain SURF_5) TaxID=2093360 RepID=A0A3A4NPI9_ABYX5|nr:MAG: hypothetical protein C4520_16645 [Candidatus Abyssubacteria bacterium SURF_5]
MAEFKDSRTTHRVAPTVNTYSTPDQNPEHVFDCNQKRCEIRKSWVSCLFAFVFFVPSCLGGWILSLSP